MRNSKSKSNNKSNSSKITAAVLIAASALSLTACGMKGINATYGTIYDDQTTQEVMATLPTDTMMPEDITSSLADGSMRYEITLDIENTGDYTLIYDYYNPSEDDESAADYFRYEVSFIGTYEKEDNNITLGAAEIGQVTWTAGSDYTSDAAYAVYSYDGSGNAGVWYSDEDAAILELFPGGSATVEDTAVTSLTIQ